MITIYRKTFVIACIEEGQPLYATKLEDIGEYNSLTDAILSFGKNEVMYHFERIAECVFKDSGIVIKEDDLWREYRRLELSWILPPSVSKEKMKELLGESKEFEY